MFAVLPCRSQFECTWENQCVHFTRRCDGVRDCLLLSSDEQGCDPSLSQNCPNPYMFNCGGGAGAAEGQCIDSSELCDGIQQCPDGSDEKVGTSLQALYVFLLISPYLWGRCEALAEAEYVVALHIILILRKAIA